MNGFGVSCIKVIFNTMWSERFNFWKWNPSMKSFESIFWIAMHQCRCIIRKISFHGLELCIFHSLFVSPLFVSFQWDAYWKYLNNLVIALYPLINFFLRREVYYSWIFLLLNLKSSFPYLRHGAIIVPNLYTRLSTKYRIILIRI